MCQDRPDRSSHLVGQRHDYHVQRSTLFHLLDFDFDAAQAQLEAKVPTHSQLMMPAGKRCSRYSDLDFFIAPSSATNPGT
jgi:hypothetical protein